MTTDTNIGAPATKTGAPVTGTNTFAQTDHHGGRADNVEESDVFCCSPCCSRPNGNHMFFPILLTTLAFILSLYAHFSCRFVERDITISPSAGEGTGTSTTLNAFSLGIWSFMDPNVNGFCYGYPSTIDFDPYFKTSRAMAPISAVLGGLVMINFWFSSCVGMQKSCWRFCAFVLILTTVCEALTFLMFKSNLCTEQGSNFKFNCKLSTGGNLSIAACVLYFVAALSVCNTPNPRGFPPDNIATVRTETIQPDGTRVIETRQIIDGRVNQC